MRIGTTAQAGSSAGTVFRVDSSGNLVKLHDFKGGGTFNMGAVFRIDASGSSTVLHHFCVTRPPPCPGTFTDWIEQLAAEAITGGCGGGNYCPGNPNTRGQMAVFITKTFNLQ